MFQQLHHGAHALAYAPASLCDNALDRALLGQSPASLLARRPEQWNAPGGGRSRRVDLPENPLFQATEPSGGPRLSNPVPARGA